MEFLNLKKYSNEFFNFIYNTAEELVYTTKRKVDKKEEFLVCSYDIKNDFEKIIKRFEVNDISYYDYKIFYKEDILFILYKKNNILNVSKIQFNGDKTNEEKFNIYLEGEIKHINIINSRYFIVFIEKADFLGRQFLKFRSSKSFRYKFAYLIDLSDIESYFIKDIKFVLGARDYIQLEHIKNEEVLFFEEAYREAWEKEFYYFKGLFDTGKKIKQENSINYINLSKFVDSIKAGEDNLKFLVIDNIDKSGVIKYLGSDKKNLYYRKKYFDTEVEKIYSIKKDSGDVLEVCDINHANWKGDFYYDSDKSIVFYEEENGDYIKVKGVFNKIFNITYNKNVGGFEDFIDDRYVITYYSDDVDGESFDYAVIRDITLNKEYQYEGQIRCFKNYVILY
ncbi:MAG: hypothetical protein ACRDCW_00790 [Sarcina sp.]